MAKTLTEKIKEQLMREGLALRSNKARKWLRAKMLEIKNSVAPPLFDEPRRTRLKRKVEIGKMYFFVYDPKTKDKLPYYDLFPLVIPIGEYRGKGRGFLGLNLHYVHPKNRIELLDKLEQILSNRNYTPQAKYLISYQYIKMNSRRLFEAGPCVKRYLAKHVDSPFLEVPPDEWDIAAMLPTEGFVKKTKNSVWAKSRSKF